MSREVLFTLDALKVLDFGKIGVAFQNEVQRVVKDCIDRPGEAKARVVSLKFLFAPEEEDSNLNCDHVKVQCEIVSGIPKRRTRIYSMSTTAAGGLRFHPELPEEPDGSTLYDEQAEKEDSDA